MSESRAPARVRRVLDTELIVKAAIAIADQEDLAALTMRRLAQDLDVATMTVYGYFDNKEQILDAMADSIMGGFDAPIDAEDATPRAVFVSVTTAFAELLRTHPSVARLLTMRVTDSPLALDGSMEKILDRFIASGMDGLTAVRAYGAMMQYSLGNVLYQLPRPWGDLPAEETRVTRSTFYRSLDAERFPRLNELADLLPGLPSTQQFLVGVLAIADGLGLE